jgi:hypothetical protein
MAASSRAADGKLRDLLRLKHEASTATARHRAGVWRRSRDRDGLPAARDAAGLSWPLPHDLDDGALETRLFQRSALVPDRAVPTWAEIHQELEKPA